MKNIFGENLRKLRIAKNYTQEQAAQLLNVSAKSLSVGSVVLLCRM